MMQKKRFALAIFAAVFLAGCNTAGGEREEVQPSTDQEQMESTQSQEETISETITLQEESDTMKKNGLGYEVGDLLNGIVHNTDCPKEVYEKRADVAYGSVTHVTYHSSTTGTDRGFNIILPANYSTDKKYPVVYLLHGIFGDENVLINDENNKLVEILGNLAADGTAKEIIMVLPNIYVTSDPEMKPAFSPESVLPYNDFIFDLVNDLMPYVQENYSVLTGRDNQAIAGFSMGGRETLFIGLSRPALLAYVCAISPAPGLTPG